MRSQSQTQQQTRSGRSQLDDYWATPVGFHPVYAVTRLDPTGGLQLEILAKLDEIANKTSIAEVDLAPVLQKQQQLIDEVSRSTDNNTASSAALLETFNSHTQAITNEIRNAADRIVNALGISERLYHGSATLRTNGREWVFIREILVNYGHIGTLSLSAWFAQQFGGQTTTKPFAIFIKAFGGSAGASTRTQFVASPLAFADAGVDVPCFAEHYQIVPTGTSISRLCDDWVVQARTDLNYDFQSISLDFRIQF